MDLSWDFKAKEATFLALGLDFIEKESLDLIGLKNLFIGSMLQTVFLSPLFKLGLLWDNNTNNISLKRVTIDKDLSDIEGLSNLLLNLVGSDVLTLSKLEDILLSVNDLKGTVGEENADITSVNPALFIDTFSGLLRLTEVTLKVVVALVAHFTTGGGAALLILILRGVVHIRYINELDVEALVGTTDMATSRILGPGNGCRGTALSLAITLKDLAAKSNLKELEDLLSDGSGSSNHDAYSTSKHVFELIEDKFVINCMSCLRLGSKIG